MKIILIIVVLLIITLAIFALIAQKPKTASTDKINTGLPSFYGKPALTDIEQTLYHRLIEALPECIILAQVQVSQIVGIQKGPNWQTWFNKTSRKSVDYLVCLKDFNIVAAIELDDSSHNREDRQKADADKEIALLGAGYKVIRWTVKSLPSIEVIKKTFHD